MSFSSLLSAAASTAEAEGVIDRLQSYVATEDMSVAQQQLADSGYWSSVGIITLTGMLVVFAILGLLIFLFWGMGKIFSAKDNNDKKKTVIDNAISDGDAAKASASVVAASADSYYNNDDEVIAVISAAIAAYSAQDGKSYQIRSITRRDNRMRSAWSLAGISDNTRPF